MFCNPCYNCCESTLPLSVSSALQRVGTRGLLIAPFLLSQGTKLAGGSLARKIDVSLRGELVSWRRVY